MPEIADRIAVAEGLAARIRSYVDGLDAQQLAGPSACAEWQVVDVFSHLIGGAERQTESMRRGRAGDAGPLAGFVPMPSAELSAVNARRDIDRRERLGGDILGAYDSAYEELHRELAGFGPDDWDTPCWHLRRGAMPAAEYVDLRIQELAIHDWDMRSALEPEATIADDSLAALFDMSPKWLGMCFRPGPRLESNVVYRFDIGSDQSRSFVVTVEGDRFDFSKETGSEAPSLVVSCEASEYLLFTYGRRNAAEGLRSGKLKAAGDITLLERFEEWFRGL
jgi:uncharacterized protein (TIGR03083 family)